MSSESSTWLTMAGDPKGTHGASLKRQFVRRSSHAKRLEWNSCPSTFTIFLRTVKSVMVSCTSET